MLTTSPGVAPPRSLLVGRRLGLEVVRRARSRGMRGARVARACRRVLAAARPVGRPDRNRDAAEGDAALAPSRSWDRVPGRHSPGPWCPSCESSSSASSRGAKPAMALLRFSGGTLHGSGRHPGAASCVGEPSSLSAFRLRPSAARPGRGESPPPQPCAPLQSVPTVRGRCRFVPAPVLPGVPRAAFQTRRRSLFKALIPGRSAWRSWRTAACSPGVSPL